MTDANVNKVTFYISEDVFRKTGIKIPPQKRESVTTAMKYVYTNHARSIVCPGSAGKQVDELNRISRDIIVKNVLNSLEQHVTYLKQLETNKNEKQLLPYPDKSVSRKTTNASFDFSVGRKNKVNDNLGVVREKKINK
jgi:hypothetical protein